MLIFQKKTGFYFDEDWENNNFNQWDYVTNQPTYVNTSSSVKYEGTYSAFLRNNNGPGDTNHSFGGSYVFIKELGNVRLNSVSLRFNVTGIGDDDTPFPFLTTTTGIIAQFVPHRQGDASRRPRLNSTLLGSGPLSTNHWYKLIFDNFNWSTYTFDFTLLNESDTTIYSLTNHPFLQNGLAKELVFSNQTSSGASDLIGTTYYDNIEIR